MAIVVMITWPCLANTRECLNMASSWIPAMFAPIVADTLEVQAVAVSEDRWTGDEVAPPSVVQERSLSIRWLE